jgi:hypothetical protein
MDYCSNKPKRKTQDESLHCATYFVSYAIASAEDGPQRQTQPAAILDKYVSW